MAVHAKGDGYFTKPVDVVELTERIDTILQRDETKGYRILIVDDDVVTANYYGAILRNAGMIVQLLNEPTRILSVMTDFRPELLLLDVYMPLCSGIELSHLIRQDNSYVDVPIVFLSSEADPQKQLEAVRAGADDFITKPVTPDYLISSLARAERYRSLRALIMRDGLTGLYNHTAIKEHLAAEILQAHRNATPLALAMIDLDYFKQVNDQHGHAAGDHVLRMLARLLRSVCAVPISSGVMVVKSLLLFFRIPMRVPHAGCWIRSIAFAKILQHSENREFSSTFSAGIADLELSGDVDTLFDAADAAMYVSNKADAIALRSPEV
jgi:PleD family two-component response regulator